MHVAIVDDDLWVRHGRATALAGEPGFHVVEMTPHQAMDYGSAWEEVEVALVDAHDATEPFDRFPGVRVVETIRAHPGRRDTVVIVVSGHCANIFLRLRMAEAGADFFYSHEDVPDLPSLISVIQNPDPVRKVAPPEPAVLAAMGLSPGSRPNAALHFLEDEGLIDTFDAFDSFDERPSQKTLALSRRSIMRVRKEMARLAGLTPSKPVGASRQLDAPEWRAVVDFVNRARGAERRNVTLDTAPAGQASPVRHVGS